MGRNTSKSAKVSTATTVHLPITNIKNTPSPLPTRSNSSPLSQPDDGLTPDQKSKAQQIPVPVGEVKMRTVSIPDHYGDKVCTVCTPTVAEYVNGREYPMPTVAGSMLMMDVGREVSKWQWLIRFISNRHTWIVLFPSEWKI